MNQRNSHRMPIIALVFIFGLASIAAAQMMGGGHGQVMMNQADSTSRSTMMGDSNMSGMGMTGMMSRMDSMMDNMSQHCKMMSNEFSKLKDHFDSMMQINDMKTLKYEMKKHQDMMNDMRQGMMQQKSMCQNMMSMMGTGGMHGMMGMSATEPEGSQHQEHPSRYGSK